MGELSSSEAELLVLKCNKVAMETLKQEKYREALSLLNKALEQLNAPDKHLQNWPNRLSLLGITLNNFGCFYKKKGQPNVALFYLQKALNIEKTTNKDSINIAGTHLNICAILSQLNRHEAALQHAKQALEALKTQHEIETGSEAEEYAREESQGGENLRLTLIIAYHNVAAELEHLNSVDEAIEMYEKADEMARNELEPLHPLRVSVSGNYEKARARGKNLSVLLSERQILRTRARVGIQERSRSPTDLRGPVLFKGLEVIQRLPSIKRGMINRGLRTSSSPKRKMKSGKLRFQRLNYSLYDPKERAKTASDVPNKPGFKGA